MLVIYIFTFYFNVYVVLLFACGWFRLVTPFSNFLLLKLCMLFAAWKSSLVLYAILLAFGVGDFSQEIRKESQFVTADVYYIGI